MNRIHGERGFGFAIGRSFEKALRKHNLSVYKNMNYILLQNGYLLE